MPLLCPCMPAGTLAAPAARGATHALQLLRLLLSSRASFRPQVRSNSDTLASLLQAFEEGRQTKQRQQAREFAAMHPQQRAGTLKGGGVSCCGRARALASMRVHQQRVWVHTCENLVSRGGCKPCREPRGGGVGAVEEGSVQAGGRVRAQRWECASQPSVRARVCVPLCTCAFPRAVT